MKQAQEIYLKNGIVLAQEGLVSPKEAEVLENTNLLLDVMGYVDMTKRDSFALFHQRIFHSNGGQLAFLGYKLILDGSPQGKTAWLEQPYEGEETYCGYPVHTDEAVTAYCRIALKEQMQLLVHCNGDGAVKQLLRCYEAAKQMEKPKKDIRLVMVHGQILPRECLPKVKELGIIPSFFVDHTYEWGDLHRKKLGKRSAFISPVKTALHLGIPATLHQDTPVLLPNMICTLWCATNRKTKSGVVLGKEECLSTLEALECVTKNAAYQYFAEQKRGSISVGKNADFVILSENPLEKKVENLRDIFVVTTIKGGKVLYQKE